jgi:methionyl aminopeptidase
MARLGRRGITQRSAADLAVMRRAGRVVAEMHDAIRAALVPGVTTGELDLIGRTVLSRRGALSNFLGYHGFPAVICTSVNDQVVHGIPGSRRLQEGDIISIDCGAIIDGWHGDAAFTAGVGAISAEARRLIDATEAALAAAVQRMVAGNTLGDVGYAVEHVARRAQFGIVDGYCGHGIGRAMHEEPDVLNTGRPGKGARLAVGNVLAIEPMFSLSGEEDSITLADGWTVLTADGSLSAHSEHTVAITDNGPEILTLP